MGNNGTEEAEVRRMYRDYCEVLTKRPGTWMEEYDKLPQHIKDAWLLTYRRLKARLGAGTDYC